MGAAETRPQTALVVEGGGMRGIFAAGVLDVFDESGLGRFDLYIGVSAGALTLSSYLAGQKGRAFEIMTGACMTPEFINFKRFLGGGHWVDMDWAFETWEREYPLDVDAAIGRLDGRPFLTACTSVESGGAVYLEPGKDDWTDCLRATSALPVYSRNFVEIEGRLLADGSVAAPIPVDETISRGASRIVVIRTRPAEYRVRLGPMEYYIAFKIRRYRQLQAAGYRHPGVYNRSVDLLRRPPSGVEVVEVGPSERLLTSRTRPTDESLAADYASGRRAARQALAAIERLVTGQRCG